MIVDEVSAQNPFLSRFDRLATFLYTRRDELNKRFGTILVFLLMLMLFQFYARRLSLIYVSYNLLLTNTFVTLNDATIKNDAHPFDKIYELLKYLQETSKKCRIAHNQMDNN